MAAIDVLLNIPPGMYRLKTAKSSEAISRGLAARGHSCWVVELAGARSSRGALNAFERALQPPDPWVRSWDALYDLLVADARARDAHDARHRALILADAAAFARQDPPGWAALLDQLWDAVRQRATGSSPLTVFIRRAPASAAAIREVTVL